MTINILHIGGPLTGTYKTITNTQLLLSYTTPTGHNYSLHILQNTPQDTPTYLYADQQLCYREVKTIYNHLTKTGRIPPTPRTEGAN